MQANFQAWVHDANKKIAALSENVGESIKLEKAIDLANHILSLLTDEAKQTPGDVIGDQVIDLPNAERFDSWFQNHPDFAGQKSVFEILDGNSPKLQAKFYWLKKRSNALMAGAVHFTPNWEDADWSRKDPYKVGIDFFLSPDSRSMHIALSNFGKLRVLELSERLTNTDAEVLEKWHNLGSITSLELLHSTIWDSFKLQSVNAKFYNGVADAFTELQDYLIQNGKPEHEGKLFASRLLGRLIFVWFLRKMNLISTNFHYFEPFGQDQGHYYHSSLERLFFQTLNTPTEDRKHNLDGAIDLETPYLNGGLFSPREDDWVGENLPFPEEYFSRLFDHFGNFNFTTDESTPEYEQVAIDPEMLGRVFESLLASQVESTGEQARKAKGAFYTPREIVAYMCTEAVRNYLSAVEPTDPRMLNAVSKLLDTPDQIWSQASSNNLGDIPSEIRDKLSTALSEFKTVDPACGSGAFPLGLLQLLTKLQTRLNPKLNVYNTKLTILQNNIFGSDIEPMAVEISRLRSWLSLIVEEGDREIVEPLPNLDFNFVCANSLLPLVEADLFTDHKVQAGLENLRRQYFSATSPEIKKKIQMEYQRLSKPDLIDIRSNQLRSFNPFDSESTAEFFDAEIMFGITTKFDLVIGNPPYVSAISAKKSLSQRDRDSFKRLYKSASGAYDLHLLFMELGLNLLKQNGTLAFITPTKYVSAHYGKEFRKLSSMDIESVTDFDNARVFDSAGVSTFVSFFRKASLMPQVTVRKMSLATGTFETEYFSRESLTEFPEDLWGHLLWGDYDINSRLNSECDPLEMKSEVVASSTAAEADLWAGFVGADPKSSTLKILNTGTIDKIQNSWGQKTYANKGSKILEPYLEISTIGLRRVEMFKAPKLIVAKLSKSLKASLDSVGEFASSNTVFIREPIEPYSIYSLAGIINSSLMSYIYRSYFSGLNLLGSFQFQAPQLKLLPIPKTPSTETLSLIDIEVRRILNNEVEIENSSLNDLVFRLYSLSEIEITKIYAWLEKY